MGKESCYLAHLFFFISTSKSSLNQYFVPNRSNVTDSFTAIRYIYLTHLLKILYHGIKDKILTVTIQV